MQQMGFKKARRLFARLSNSRAGEDAREVARERACEDARTPAGLTACWHIWQRVCSIVIQGLLGCFGAVLAASAACPGPAPAWQRLSDTAWLVPGQLEEANASNRGQVLNQVLVQDGKRLWLVGAGATPAAARALGCHIEARFGQAVTDVVVPWARGEHALGLAGWPGTRTWAHAQVVISMRAQCVTCLKTLRDRLGEAAVDLGPSPIRLPQQHLHGERGRLGPWQWWALPREKAGMGKRGSVALVMHLSGTPLWLAPPWLGHDGAPPDARGADVALLLAGAQRLQSWARANAGSQWLAEQGGTADASAAQRVLRYWQAMDSSIDAALARGELPNTPLPLVDAAGSLKAWQQHPQHALNWQRAWRQAEDRLLK
jgi:hypothetical protein